MRKKVNSARYLSVSVLSLTLVASPGVGWADIATSHSPDVSTTSTSSTNALQSVTGTVNPLVTAGKASFVSQMVPDKQMSLAFLLKPRQMSKLEQIVATGHNVSPQDYQTQFAPTADATQTVQSFIAQSGLTVVSSQSDLILVKGTVDQVQKALHVKLNNYVANKKSFFSTANNPTVPAGVAENLVSIVGLNDVTYTTGPLKAHADPTSGNALPQFLTPDAVRTAYGLIPAYTNGIDGTGEKIAILMSGGFDNADVKAFSDQFGIPYQDSNIQAVKVPGTPDPMP
ncbi:MAG: protease pro-enzyme activation domain-containing protein, partial [Tumebacillaceae bacterium]